MPDIRHSLTYSPPTDLAWTVYSWTIHPKLVGAMPTALGGHGTHQVSLEGVLVSVVPIMGFRDRDCKFFEVWMFGNGLVVVIE